MGLVFLVAFLGAPQDGHIGFRVREWRATLDGRVQDADSGGSEIDADSTLGLGGPELFHEVEFYARVPLVGRLYAGRWWGSFEGKETLDETIRFEGETFPAGMRVESDLDADMYYLNWELLGLSPSLGAAAKAEVGLLLGGRFLVAEVSIESDFGGVEEEGSGGVPVLGGRAALQVTPWLRADVEVAGIAYSGGGSVLRYFDGFGEIVFRPWTQVFLGAGYRIASLDLEDLDAFADFDIDVRIGGAYLTAGFRF